MIRNRPLAPQIRTIQSGQIDREILLAEEVVILRRDARERELRGKLPRHGEHLDVVELIRGA